MADVWTEEMDAVLRELYPRAAWSVLEQALPGKTRRAIFHRVHRLGIRRESRNFSAAALEALRQRNNEKQPRLGTGRQHSFIWGIEGKGCSACGTWKAIEKFSAHQSCAGGRRHICKDCSTAKSKLWAQANPERMVARVRRWQQSHPEKYRHVKQAGKRRRYGRLVQGRVTGRELAEKFAACGGLCAYCKLLADSWDHVLPLARGGAHSIENMVPACKACNFSKQASTVEEWKARKGG